MYSKRAMPHEKRMTMYSGQDDEMPAVCSLRWPYQATVMKMLLMMRRIMVVIAGDISKNSFVLHRKGTI